MTSRARLGEILIDQGLLTEQQLGAALREQQKSGEQIGQVLVRLGVLEREQLSSALGEQTRRWITAGLTAGFLTFQPGVVVARTIAAQLSVSVEVLGSAAVAVQYAKAAASPLSPGVLSLTCGPGAPTRVTYERASFEPLHASEAAAATPYVAAQPVYRLHLQPLGRSILACAVAGQEVALKLPAVLLKSDEMNIEVDY
jgi:hypothetical protein